MLPFFWAIILYQRVFQSLCQRVSGSVSWFISGGMHLMGLPHLRYTCTVNVRTFVVSWMISWRSLLKQVRPVCHDTLTAGHHSHVPLPCLRDSSSMFLISTDSIELVFADTLQAFITCLGDRVGFVRTVPKSSSTRAPFFNISLHKISY